MNYRQLVLTTHADARFQEHAETRLTARSITEQWRLHMVWHLHVFSANVAG